MSKIKRQRWFNSLSLVILIALGLLSKSYRGFGHEWVNDSSGDIFYEIFWCLLIFLLVPVHSAVNKIPIWVLGITCLIEFSQLWRYPELDTLRSTFLGRLLLGNVFDWWDFLYYGVGCLLGWLWLRLLARRHLVKF
jgi:hypothetical protein